MKKISLSAVLILVFVIYIIHQKTSNEVNMAKAIPIAPEASNAPAADSLPGSYKDGQYQGELEDAFYGNIQVKAVISGGRISDVEFLQYPSDRETSVQINSQAMPLLRQEAISAQSAKVDIISGATQSSQAFILSLQSALNQASD